MLLTLTIILDLQTSINQSKTESLHNCRWSCSAATKSQSGSGSHPDSFGSAAAAVAVMTCTTGMAKSAKSSDFGATICQ